MSDEIRWTKEAALAAGALAVAAGEVLNANDDGIKNLRRALQNYDREVMAMHRDDHVVEVVETALTDTRTCRNCDHWGADPDGEYCAHPQVMTKHAIGLNLSKAISFYCAPRTADVKHLQLWEPRKPR